MEQGFMEKFGLSNHSAPSWAEMATETIREYRAYCMSERCGRKYSIKRVDRGTTCCPDCSHALVWKTFKKMSGGEYVRTKR